MKLIFFSVPDRCRIRKLLVILIFMAVSLFALTSAVDINKICGYGTARCRWNCKREEFKIGTCLNTSKCCLKKWNAAPVNPVKH
uniref:Beta-defensin n=1 Tax=Rhinolophus ferrumequinum TaxID=59479 RepID=A0A671FDP5_RHIFE